MKSALRYLIAIILAAGALYLAFHGQDLDTLEAELARTNIAAIIAGTILQLLAHFLRAWRWRYLLRPLKPGTNLWVGFKAVLIGYALNNVIPRAGEVGRPLVMSQREKIPFSGALGTIVLERVFDILMVGILLFLSYMVYAEVILQSFPDLIGSATMMVIVLFGGLILLISAMLNRSVYRGVEKLIAKLLPQKVANVATKLLGTFTEGLRGANRTTAIPIFAGTAAIWAMYWLSMYAFLHALPSEQIATVGFWGITLLLTLSAVAVAIPTPGGLGTYHYFISQALVLVFGLNKTVALAFATLSHLAPYLVVTVVGIAFAFKEGVSLKVSRTKTEEPRV